MSSAAECSNYQDAWYYDDPVNPTKILVCGDLCAEIQGVSLGVARQIDVLFGCATKVPVPK